MPSSEQRLDHCANWSKGGGAHDVRAVFPATRGNIDLDSMGERWMNTNSKSKWQPAKALGRPARSSGENHREFDRNAK